VAVAARVRSLLASERVSRSVATLYGGNVPSRVGRIDIRSPAVGKATAAELIFRLYERHELALIRRTLRPGLDVVELGAGIGVTGALLVKRLAAGRQLVLVEANQDLIPTLKENLRRQNSGAKVSVVHAAVAYEGSSIAFHQAADHIRSRVGSIDVATDVVPAISLDAIVREHQLDRFVLVADIEGAEKRLLANEAEVLGACEQIIAELHGTDAEIATMVCQLADLGLRVVERRKASFSFARS